MTLVRAALALCLVGGAALRPSAPARKCLLMVLNVDRYGVRTPMFGDNSSWDAAGNVRLQCRNQKVFLDTDSISVLSGEYVRLYGHAVYRDTAYRYTADTMIYVVRSELIQARGHVHAYDLATGSTLVGPYVDYYRQVKGVNDSARILALSRPTVREFARTAPVDTVHQKPYVLVGDILKGFGQSRLTGTGSVTIDHDSLHGIGDSLDYLRGRVGMANLVGKPARIWRVGDDSLLLVGLTIHAVLDSDRVRDLFAYQTAHMHRGTTDIVGDTIQLGLAQEKLAHTFAWAHTKGATLHSGGYDLAGDSLAVDTPGEQLREIRLFGRAVVTSPPDSAGTAQVAPPATDTTRADTTRPARPRNRIWGDRVTATFVQADSAGTAVTRITGLVALGAAQSLFYRNGMKNSQRVPSVNFIQRSDTIIVVMRTDSAGVEQVQARGHVYGVQADSNENALVRRRPAADSTVPPTKPKRP